MNMRQHKRMVVRRMSWIVRAARFGILRGNEGIGRSFAAPDWVGHNDPALINLSMSMFASREDLEAAKVEQAKQEFVCIKVNGGAVVDTFDNLDAAKALVMKHVRGKKAKLMVMDSSTGEPVMFGEEELA